MSSNAEVSKSGSESSLSLIRKFSRKVQGAGIIPTVRGARYHSRSSSKTTRKKQALKRIERHLVRDQLIREGKLTETAPRRGGPQSSMKEASAPRENRNSGLEGTPIAR